MNAYNDIVRGELARAAPPRPPLRHRRMFRTAGREIDGLWFSPDVIEHGLLRGNRRPPSACAGCCARATRGWPGAVRSRGPAIHFALNCGARSCPPVRHYDRRARESSSRPPRRVPAGRDDGDRRRAVALPYLMRLYRADFPEPVSFAHSATSTRT